MYVVAIDPSQKPVSPFVTVFYVWQAMALSLSHIEKYIAEKRGQCADRQDRAGYFWYEIKFQVSNFVIF